MSQSVVEFDESLAFRNHPLISSAYARGENRNVFEAFIRGFVGDLNPEGPIEATLAARAAGLAWRLNRAQKLETLALIKPDRYENTPVMAGLVNSDGRQTLEMISRWEQSLERSLFKALEALERVKKQKRARIEPSKNTPIGDKTSETQKKEPQLRPLPASNLPV